MEYIEPSIEFNEKEAEDVTEFMKERYEEKWKYSIKKVLKYQKLYKIYFCFGYTAFGQEIRYARRIGEVKWYSKIATLERKNKYTLEHYIKEFKRNKIYFDGENIPIFIDTIEDVQKKFNKSKAKKSS